MDGDRVSWTGSIPGPGLVAGSTGMPTQMAGAARPPADLGTPTRIVLVRHGVTDFTAAGKLDGRGGPDPSLNAYGRRQAHAAAVEVRALVGSSSAHIVTSSLKRAIQTGTAIAQELGVRTQIDADWDEQSFGDWDDKSMDFLAARHSQELLRFRADLHYSRPGGEAHVDLQARVLAAFDRAAAAGGTVVVASHRKPIVTVLAHLLGIPYERIWRIATAPASLTSVEVWADGGMSVAFVNDTRHLT